MNQEQERHMKAIAWKVLTQLDVMTAHMQGIVNHSLRDVPVETIAKTFTESIPHSFDRIQDILSEMQEESEQ